MQAVFVKAETFACVQLVILTLIVNDCFASVSYTHLDVYKRQVLAALGETAPESDFAAMAALNAKTGCPVPASLSVLNTLRCV